jgi:nucleoside phosphorylase
MWSMARSAWHDLAQRTGQAFPDHRSGPYRRRDRRCHRSGPRWLNGPAPLALFDGLRTDFSLARLAHYTGTNPADFQRYILFTNYHRYVDEFVDWAGRQLGQDDFVALTGAGGLALDTATDNARERLSDTAWRRHQMPAYHLIRPDRSGITLVNIGVGPSNAKTICDHLAVLRPEAWLMIGHCGGLRPTQKIGDYVLAHAYLRDDHVLDDVLPRKSRFRPSPKCRWRWPARPKSSAAAAARTSRPACAPAPSSRPTTATGNCAIPIRPAASA